MAFTFVQPRQLRPEQVNPMANLITKALQGYGQGVRAAYLPKELEADIFAKQLTPLATLATSPMFLQNPQFQTALGNLISRNLSMFGGHEFKGMEGSKLPTYAEQVGKDVNEAQELSKELSSEGKLKTGTSGLAGAIENYLGAPGKSIVDFLGKGEINSELANKQNRFENILSTLKNNAVQTGRLSAKDAEDIFSPLKNETQESRFNRIKKTAPFLFEQNESPNPATAFDEEEQRNKENEDLRFSMDLSEKIYQKTGKIVPETVIFNYMQEHPGKIHIPSLLKAAGIK